MEDFQIFFMILLVALPILVTLAYRQKEKEKSKDEMIQSLLTDLNSHDELYEKGIKSSRKYKFQKAFGHPLPMNGFKSAVSSDRYLSLSPETQEKFSEYYEEAQRMNEYVKKLEGEEITLVIQKIGNEQNGILNNLRHISPELRSLLESE